MLKGNTKVQISYLEQEQLLVFLDELKKMIYYQAATLVMIFIGFIAYAQELIQIHLLKLMMCTLLNTLCLHYNLEILAINLWSLPHLLECLLINILLLKNLFLHHFIF